MEFRILARRYKGLHLPFLVLIGCLSIYFLGVCPGSGGRIYGAEARDTPVQGSTFTPFE